MQSVAEYKRLGRKMNAYIREELNSFSLNERIDTYRNMWKEYHIQRMLKNRIPAVLTEYTPSRRTRSLGCMMKRWNISRKGA